MEQNSQLLKNSERSFTIDKKKVIAKRHSSNHQRQKSHDLQGSETTTTSNTTTAAHEHAHRSRIVRNRTILGSFPLFYKLSQSLSSLNTKSEVSNSCSAFVKTNVENSSSSDR